MWTDIIAATTGIILAITALEIYYYTIATNKLTNLTEKQIKINIKPIIVVLHTGSSLILKNIGKSPALNIMVKEVLRVDNSANLNNKYVFKFTKITVCGLEEEHPVGVTPYCNDKAITASGDADRAKEYFLACNSLSEGQNYEVIIDYEDIEKGKWRSISIIDNKGVHFKEVTELS